MPERPVEIVRLRPDDWRDLKAIRLEALRCEPAAFSSSFAESVTRSDDDWRQRLANTASVTLVARTQDRPIGMAGMMFGADGEIHAGMVFGMFVSEMYRGQGIGRLLLRALLDETKTHVEITTVRLWVTPTQTSARRLYESFGFQCVENPDRSMLDGPGAHEEIAMERVVRGRTA